MTSPEPRGFYSTVYGFRWSTGPFGANSSSIVLAVIDECQRPGARLAK